MQFAQFIRAEAEKYRRDREVDRRAHELSALGRWCFPFLARCGAPFRPAPPTAICTFSRPRYALSPNRTYTPAPAPLDQYRKVAAALRLTRAVVVQPSAYGTDNSCTLDAVAALGASARAVVGIDAGISDDELLRLHSRGARGVRVNAASRGLRDSDEIADLVTAIARRIDAAGLACAALHRSGGDRASGRLLFSDAARADRDRPYGPRPGDAGVRPRTGSPRYAICSRAAGAGSSCRALTGCPPRSSGFDDAGAIIRALIDANPDRAVWGTDWPHTGSHGHAQSAAAPPISVSPARHGGAARAARRMRRRRRHRRQDPRRQSCPAVRLLVWRFRSPHHSWASSKCGLLNQSHTRSISC